MNTHIKILLVEDEPLLGAAVATHLKGQFSVDWVQSLEAASEAMRHTPYDLMLLDLNLPDGHGFDLLRSVRKSGSLVPIIVITARDQVRDRIAGLNAGADDYVLKPFDLDELIARIQSVRRRAMGVGSRLSVGEVEIDIAIRKIWRGDEEILLTAREWAVLDCFTQRPGAIVSKDTLEDSLHDAGADIESNAVEVYVSRIRKKLGANSIRTLRGLGYRLER